MSSVISYFKGALADREIFGRDTYNRLVRLFAVLGMLYHLYVLAIWRVYPTQFHAMVHLFFFMLFAFLVAPSSKKKGPAAHASVFDYILILLLLATIVYYGMVYSFRLVSGAPAVVSPVPLNNLELFFGILLFVILCEVARRIVGMAYVITIFVFLGAFFFGAYVIGGGWPFSQDPLYYTIKRMMWTIYAGIWDSPLRLSSAEIIIFFIFGSMMQASGLGNLLISMAKAAVGKTRGGPAKVAVVGSAFVGSITGGPASNIVMVGTFTIPMMKQMGFKPEFAGAVECAASIGASIMPPVMGALVFVLAELTNTPLVQVMIAFLIPAILYFMGILLQVHLEAVKMGMSTTKESAIKTRDILKKQGHLLIPILIVCVLLAAGMEPVNSCSIAILATLIVPFLRKETRMKWQQIYFALYQTAKSALIVAISLALAGLVLVYLFDTGVAAEMTFQVSQITSGNLLLALIITGIFSIILGTVGPALASYLIVALVIAPMIVKQGAPLLVAHVFALYLANIANITPPVAVAAFVAASLAGASYMKIGFTAMRLAIAAYFVPYIAAYRPALLILYGSPMDVLVAAVIGIIMVFCISIAAEGYLIKKLNTISRILLFAGGLVLIPPNWTLNIGAIIVIIVVLLWNLKDAIVKRFRGTNPVIT